MKLSATRLKTYLTCPRQFRYAYVDEIPSVLTGPLAFGQVIHQTLDRMHLLSLETGLPLDTEYGLSEFNRLWREALERDCPLFKDGETMIREYQELADTMLKGYVERHKDNTAPLVVEFPFQLPWGEHMLEGIIDRIDEGDNGLIIVDYKTGKRKPTQRELASDLQLTVYAFAVEQVFGQPVERIVYYHLRDQTPLLTTRSQSDFGWLCDEVLPFIIQAIEAGSFAPRPGYWCRYCDYRELCLAEGPDELPLADRPQVQSTVEVA